jgi:hypothetical protein
MARLYTSRALLDPNYISLMQNADQRALENKRKNREMLYNNLQTGIGALSKAVGQGIDTYREYAKNQEDIAKRQTLLGDYGNDDPVTKAVADRFIQTGDPSQLITLRQIQETNAARVKDAEERKAAELELKRRRFDLAKRDIESYTKPNERISAIKTAIDTGIAANQDVTELENLLEQEQEAKGKAEFIEKEKEWDKAQETKQSEIKKRTKDLIEEYVSRLEDIDDKDTYNQTLAELKTMAEANGLRSEIKFPDEKKKSRTTRTAKEEDEYAALMLDSKYGRMTIEKQQRLDKLNKLKPYSSK